MVFHGVMLKRTPSQKHRHGIMSQSRVQAKPFSLKGSYDESFVRLNEDLTRSAADVTDKVFVAVDKISEDYETTKARELDTR